MSVYLCLYLRFLQIITVFFSILTSIMYFVRVFVSVCAMVHGVCCINISLVDSHPGCHVIHVCLCLFVWCVFMFVFVLVVSTSR